MEYDWDSDKRNAILERHGVDFESVNELEWDTAIVQRLPFPDEIRYRAIGYIGPRTHVVIFTRHDQTIRVISMWQAGLRAWRRYAQT